MKILSEKQKLIRHQYNIADYWDNQDQDTPESQDQKRNQQIYPPPINGN